MKRPARYACCEHCKHTPLPLGFAHYDPCGLRCKTGNKVLTAEDIEKAMNRKESK